MTALPQEFMDSMSITTFAGATFAVTIIGAFLRRLTGINSLLLPAVLSFIVCIGFAYDKGFPHDFVGWLVIFVNICMLFFAVVGANETASNIANPPVAGRGLQQGAKGKSWFSSFF
ncbi:hypothetical protein QF019_002177 [Pseudomonas frederiksbergensis]|uniref:hypothetical protein n=1 Tax=Pseudomonas frederiksbergensis TaxID=104087 RepID=UPI003D1D06FB